MKTHLISRLLGCAGNTLADRFLVSKGYLKYKVRPFSKKFSIHLPFDYIHYPLFLLYYNQWNLNSNPVGVLLKLFVFIIPQVIIETNAEKRTDLITWKKGWSWYHSLISMSLKFLVCRLIIASIRKLNNRETSTT
ncbi:CBO0543 family protein [Bacillus solitudinis]|uniref:CBO0543 family protein n=1 Tax=Bacillus solitudinis TaxID=2014074 RepID=UPI0029DE661A|nr:CBO0543 family protein [Bacillus solitudinis]